jgi:hypothetical protein
MVAVPKSRPSSTAGSEWLGAAMDGRLVTFRSSESNSPRDGMFPAALKEARWLKGKSLRTCRTGWSSIRSDILLAAEPGWFQRNNKWHFDSAKLALSKNIKGAGVDTCECPSKKF